MKMDSNKVETIFQSRVVETDNLSRALEKIAETSDFNGLYILTDTNVLREVIPYFDDFLNKYNPEIIVMNAGEENKSLQTLAEIWERLSDSEATRRSIMINIGGGVVTDLGGFAAATFKRGIRFFNVPTTVLGAVDAAVGGKTGIDFNGFKNEIGAFAPAEKVIISSQPLASLPYSQIISGYAEIVKTALISSAEFYTELIRDCPVNDNAKLREAMTKAVRVKERVTEEDPKESGLRKILNLGHTAGHAFETLMIEKGTPIAHGDAVAHGLLVTLILSHTLRGLDSKEIYRYADGILKPLYKRIAVSCKDYDRLEQLMLHDKKNITAGEIRFVLLDGIGSPVINIPVPSEELRAALDIYCDTLGL